MSVSDPDALDSLPVLRFDHQNRGARFMSDDEYAFTLRWYLLEHLRTLPRFQNVNIQDLRPLWLAQERITGNGNWYAVPRDSPYAQSLIAFVRDSLHLCESGEASHYFLFEIHDLVRTGHRQLQIVHVQKVEVAGVLGAKADSFGSASVSRYFRGPDGVEHEALTKIGTTVNAFADWDHLRMVAHKEVDRMIDDLRHHLEISITANGFKLRNPQTFEKNMPALAVWLWYDKPSGDLSKKQRDRLLKAMRLDTSAPRGQKLARQRRK